jgi:hypothetical protein
MVETSTRGPRNDPARSPVLTRDSLAQCIGGSSCRTLFLALISRCHRMVYRCIRLGADGLRFAQCNIGRGELASARLAVEAHRLAGRATAHKAAMSPALTRPAQSQRCAPLGNGRAGRAATSGYALSPAPVAINRVQRWLLVWGRCIPRGCHCFLRLGTLKKYADLGTPGSGRRSSCWTHDRGRCPRWLQGDGA